MAGIVEEVLGRRFGAAEMQADTGYLVHVWNATDESRRCKLYFGQPRTISAELLTLRDRLRPLFGDALGGFILQGSLRIATFTREPIWGLYRIGDLQTCPAVQRAMALRPKVDYFMDAANVWYYGYAAGRLYCYDQEDDLVDDIGEAASAVDELVDQWLSAIRSS